MNDAAQLHQQLGRSLLGRTLATLAPDNEAGRRLLAVRQRLGNGRGHHALPRIAQGTLAFRMLGQQTPYPELKYACYGIAQPTDWEGRLLLDDDRLCRELLLAVGRLQANRPRAFAACCRALRTAWQQDIESAGGLSAIARKNAPLIAEFLHHLPRQIRQRNSQR